MATESYTVGPGLWTVGAAGTSQDFTAQVTELSIEWDEKVEDGVPTLDGGELAGEAAYSAKVTASVFQDLTDGGMVEWSWTNKGKLFPFTYTPNDEAGASFSGVVRVKPLDVGGEVKKKATSKIEWTCIGEPVMAHGLG